MSVLLPLIDTGPSAHGWHKAETGVCPQKWAWTYLPVPVRAPTLDLDDIVLDAEPSDAEPQLIGTDGADGPDAAPIRLDARVQPAEPLIRGTLVHVALAHYYELIRRGGRAPLPGAPPMGAGRSAGLPAGFARADRDASRIVRTPAAELLTVVSPHDALEEKIGQYEDIWPDCTADIRSKLRLVLTAYMGFYESDAERFEVIGAEVLFTETVRDVGRDGVERSAPFTQRVDLVLRQRSDGRIWYYDHKTTAHLGAKIKNRYTLSGQFLAMRYFGALRHGEEFGGVLPNLLGMNPIDFGRPPLELAPYRLTRWPRDYLYAKRMQTVLLAAYGPDPRDWPGVDNEFNCMTAYGPCPYHEMCRWGPGAKGK